jgi:ribosome biogenesis GTPase
VKHLEAYGWNSHFAPLIQPGEEEAVARVVQEHKEAYLVRSSIGNMWAEISGKMRHEAAVRADFPAVGDWVVLRGLPGVQEGTPDARRSRAAEGPSIGGKGGPVQIVRILPRKTVLARRVDAGHEQVLAVNVDIAFLGTSLNDNFNLRRLERYILMAREARVLPVVLLTKADLCEDVDPFIQEIRAAAGRDTRGLPASGDGPDPAALPVHPVSVVTGQGMEAVRDYLRPGVTAVVMGSSGIGKSTLVNHLAQEDLQDMMEIREFDDKGRHCTTFRHLVRTPMGGLIIDTPGLRGLALGEATDALLTQFGDIEALAAACRFTDCGHETEPGCAIKAALEAGTLDAERLETYQKLQRELAAIARRENRVQERKQKKLEKKATATLNKKLKSKWGERYRR